jgi:hypothetical protein
MARSTSSATRAADLAGLPCLLSPIAGLIVLPWSYAGHSFVVAIERDGSACLLLWKKVMVECASSCFPIVRLACHFDQRLIVMEALDGSFTAYGLEHPGALAVTAKRPSGCTDMWRFNWFKRSDSGTDAFHVGSSGIFFTTLQTLDLADVADCDAKLAFLLMTPAASLDR